MNKRFALLLTLLILVPILVAACGGDDEGSDELTSESFTNAWKDLLAGNPDPAKALACEDVHSEIDEAAAAIPGLIEQGGSVTADCEVSGDTASCEMTIVVEIEGQDPIETTETATWEVVDGKVCQEITE